jgi:hypothetical protein
LNRAGFYSGPCHTCLGECVMRVVQSSTAGIQVPAAYE